MGAGVVKPQPNGQGFRIHINPGQRFQSRSSNMSTNTDSKKCEECSTQFTTFKKKRLCKSCARHFCTACTVQVNGSRDSPREQQCKKCDLLMGGTFTRTQLTEWKVKDLKALLNNQNVNTSKCKEKNDLIDLVFTYFSSNPHLNRQGTEHQLLVEQLAERMRQHDQEDQQASATPRAGSQPRDQSRIPGGQQRTSGASQPSAGSPSSQDTSNPIPPPRGQSVNTSGQGTSEQSSNGGEATDRLLRQAQMLNEAGERLRQALEEEEKREPQPENPHTKLEDIVNEEEIESLSIKELKRILMNNFVDYKGCCERWELQERVRRLWRDHEANKKKIEEHRKLTDDPSGQPDTATASEDDLCKICMDAAIDCVLLECGHMVTCTSCGKRLAECPICRQFVVRAVHTFKS